MKFLIKNIKYQLYLLQLENYELGRFWKLLIKKGFWPRGEMRKSLVWTQKAVAVLAVAIFLNLLISLAIFYVLSHGLLVLSIMYYVLCILVFAVILYTLFFILYTLAVILLWPVDLVLKKIIVWKAKSKIENLKSDIKVIGIAGSYGKTTMKEVLHSVLSAKFKVLSTPESINTPVGIARWILNNFQFPISNFQFSASPAFGEKKVIAIVEMGEHYKGDVEEICKIVKPDIAVVTGINEAHLERMKKMEAIVETIFEIVSNAKAGAMVVLNGDDKNVMDHYKEFIWPDMRVAQYNVLSIKYKIFNPERLGWQIKINDAKEIFVNLLGEYALGNVDATIKIAKKLGMAEEEIIDGIKNIKPIPHRLQALRSGGDMIVVDDAYNGNPEGVKEAIKTLARFQNRRKIFITPGLVETGSRSAEIHRSIGKQLAEVADVVILIKNSVTGWIEEGLLRAKREGLSAKLEIIYFDTAQEAHQNLSNILKSGDVVLFQNDWGDQYI